MQSDENVLEEKRRERRVPASLPVVLGGMSEFEAVTKDVSATGLYFETNAIFEQGVLLNLIVELEPLTGRRILSCHGIVVRFEPAGMRFGCAVRIVDPHLLKP